MGTVLLDTNIISFIFKNDSRAALYEPFLKGNKLAISFMTVAELHQWSAMRKWGKSRIKKMEYELKKYLVLPYDINTCRLWGVLRARCNSIGKPISPQDAWIAANALQYEIPLVTHNPKDFRAVNDLEIMSQVQ